MAEAESRRNYAAAREAERVTGQMQVQLTGLHAEVASMVSYSSK